MKRRLISLLTSIMMILGLVMAVPIDTNVGAYTSRTRDEALSWVRNMVGTGIDYDGVYGNQCVDLIKAYYNFLGVEPVRGNGSDYVNNTLPSGWQRIQGAAPQPGDILVYTGGEGGYGHVAIYESDRIHYHQNFYDKNKYPNSNVVQCIGYMYNGLSNPYWGVIRPDFNTNNKWYSSMTPWNIGDSVYGAFIKKDGWVALGSVNKSVELMSAASDASDIWHFVRQEDNSYIIYNCQDNLVLDGYDDENVNLYEYYGGTCQQWYIYGRWNGEYIFRHKGTDKVLCIPGNSNEYGTKLKMSKYDNSFAQQFSIYGFNHVGTSTLSVITGNSVMSTELNWTSASDATHYNIRIKSGVPGNVETYRDFWNLKDTTYSIVLPAGYYEIYIDSCNKFSYSGSNIVSFYITAPQSGDIDGSGAVSVADAVLLQKYLLAFKDLNSDQLKLADINNDRRVNIFDLSLLKASLKQ